MSREVPWRPKGSKGSQGVPKVVPSIHECFVPGLRAAGKAGWLRPGPRLEISQRACLGLPLSSLGLGFGLAEGPKGWLQRVVPGSQGGSKGSPKCARTRVRTNPLDHGKA